MTNQTDSFGHRRPALAPDAAPRVALLADAIDALPGLAATLVQLGARGDLGFKLDLLDSAPAIAAEPYDLIHICGGGSGTACAEVLSSARELGIPVAASVHSAPSAADAPLYRESDTVLSPSRFADSELRGQGVDPDRIRRWSPGVDFECFSPACFCPEAMPAGGAGGTARINVIYAGRLSESKGVTMLADAFLDAHDRDPRLHLLVAGDGPEEARLERQLGSAATFLGWLQPAELARVLASADLFVTASASEAVGRTVLESQASGLPVLGVDSGAVAELIESGRSGFLVEPCEAALAQAIRWLARRATLRERLVTGGLLAVRSRTWERSLAQLADGWASQLGPAARVRRREAAIRAA